MKIHSFTPFIKKVITETVKPGKKLQLKKNQTQLKESLKVLKLELI